MNGFGRFGAIRLRLIGLALFSGLPLAALGIYRLSVQARHERAALVNEAAQSALNVAARIDERIRTADAVLVALSSAVRAVVADSAANRTILQRTLARVQSPVSNLFLLDTTGTLRASARTVGAAGEAVRAFANRGYFNIVRRDTGLVVGEIRRSVVLPDHPWVVVVSRSILDDERRFAGVVSLTLRLDSLVSEAGTVSAVGAPLITIVDTSGVVLARSVDHDSIVGQQRFHAGLNIDTSGAGNIRGVDGVRRLTGFTRTRTAPWLVNVGVPQAAMDSRLSESLRLDLVLFLIALLTAVTTAYLVGQRITEPLLGLVNAARAFERGETGTRASTSGPREVGLLGNAFNQMAETVERRNVALADSERRYRLLFDSNPLPMWAWDAGTTQIMAINEAAIEKYGYDRETFLSLRVTDLLDPSELERFSGARLPFSETRQSAGLWLHRTRDGRQVAMDVVTTSSRRLGRASWLSVGIDVTARREAERALARSEEQLRQSQKMEAIGTFAGGISHDFNNLLTGMLGYCDLALAELPPDSSARSDIEEIRALAMRGSDLARQILTVSRKQVVQPTRLDPNEIVRGIDRLLRRIVGAHIDIDVRLADEIGTMRADAGQLEQVLLNLAANARDAMPTGGALRITTRVVSKREAPTIDLPVAHDWILLSVGDTGTGMSPEVRERIFEPFFTTKERGKGTGLGLALAYAMVEQSGGVVRVETALGKGTTFSLYFPRLEHAADTKIRDGDATEVLDGTETILLAEDEESVRNVATAALERHGYTVLAAPDGAAAVALSRAYAGRIDLLLTDVVMPGMNGRELAETMRRLRVGIRVLYCSGYTEDQSLLGDLRKDEHTFLQKPFTARDLARRVRSALDQAVATR